ncbi:unnamed protein product, partial [Rotaria magnacalcarata]
MIISIERIIGGSSEGSRRKVNSNDEAIEGDSRSCY